MEKHAPISKPKVVEKKYILPFILVTSLFALWGFANDITNPMVAAFQTIMEIPVAKGTSGILIIPTFESKRDRMKDCIRCTKCIHVCPMGLNPTLLMILTEYSEWDRAEKGRITDCIECGSCSYTCPSDRPLLDYIRLGKGKVMGNIRARKN